MVRILLIVEEMGLLNQLKLLLSKLGFPIEGSAVDLGLRDHFHSFNPEVILVLGNGRKVNPATVLQRAREFSKDVKVILLAPQVVLSSLVELQNGTAFDAKVQFPGDPQILLETLNSLLRTKHPVDLVEKYKKLGSIGLDFETNAPNVTVPESKSQPVGSIFDSKFATSRDDRERDQAYEELTKTVDFDPQGHIPKAKAKEKWDQLKSSFDDEKLKDIDAEKRRFVDELFRKK